MLTPLDESGKKDKREAQSRQGNNGQDDFVCQLTLTGELRVHSAFIAHGNVGFQHETERYDTCALQAHKPHYIVYTRPVSIADDGRVEGRGGGHKSPAAPAGPAPMPTPSSHACCSMSPTTGRASSHAASKVLATTPPGVPAAAELEAGAL